MYGEDVRSRTAARVEEATVECNCISNTQGISKPPSAIWLGLGGWGWLAGRPVLVFIISAAPRTQLHLCTNNARKTLGVYGSRASAPPQSRIGFPSGRPLLAASCGSRGLQVRARVRNLRARVALLEHCAATSGPPRPGIAVLCLSTATYLQTTHPLPACCSPCPSQGC